MSIPDPSVTPTWMDGMREEYTWSRFDSYKDEWDEGWDTWFLLGWMGWGMSIPDPGVTPTRMDGMRDKYTWSRCDSYKNGWDKGWMSIPDPIVTPTRMDGMRDEYTWSKCDSYKNGWNEGWVYLIQVWLLQGWMGWGMSIPDPSVTPTRMDGMRDGYTWSKCDSD